MGSTASNGSATQIESGEKCETGASAVDGGGSGGLSTTSSDPATATGSSSRREGSTTLIMSRGDDALRGSSDGRAAGMGVGVTGEASAGTELTRRSDLGVVSPSAATGAGAGVGVGAACDRGEALKRV